ncbi:MAG TPA: threonine synthase [Xanthomonadales bacterium]|nr:threonine synthase [Xanthomonadales bacterium]
MRYFSTRDQRQEWPVTLDAALSAGLAADGGLYVPERRPSFKVADFDGLTNLPAIAERLLTPFFAGSSLAPQLGAICREALDLPCPIVALPPSAQGESFLLELFHGPTAAFKDFAARFLAACLARLRRPDDEQKTVLVATSGDTGGAVAAAFHRRAGFRVVILYPDGRVSARQAHQLGAFGDNVHALKVDGSFDDCQRMVKSLLGDRHLATRFALTSANSISLGRLLPQMAYYAYAALKLRRESGIGNGESAELPTLIIPTGNLGNALAAILVREMGLPLGDIHFATNANRTLPDFFGGGEYRGRPSVATLANAMDVGDPSNFERLAWFFRERNLRQSGIHAHSIDDATIRRWIAAGELRHGQVYCPHTACAAEVHQRLRDGGAHGRMLLVATAHPAKFNDVVEPLIGHEVAAPPALSELLQRPSSSEALAATSEALVARLEQGW